MPAEVSRARGRAGFRLPGAFRRDRSRTEASPRPDRLGHLMSRARRDAGWRGQRRRGTPVKERPRRAHRAGPLARAPADDPLTRGRLAGFHSELASLPVQDEPESPPEWMVVACATTPGVRAASRVPPRRGARSAAPEVPFIGGYPIPKEGCYALLRGGVRSSPQVVPNLWTTGQAPFHSPWSLPPLTGRQGTGTRPLRGDRH